MRPASSYQVQACACLLGCRYVSRLLATPLIAISRAFGIVKAERDPIVIAKIELAEIPLQVFLADVMIDAVDAALEDREIALNSVGVGISANVFLGGMVDYLMAGEARANFR